MPIASVVQAPSITTISSVASGQVAFGAPWTDEPNSRRNAGRTSSITTAVNTSAPPVVVAAPSIVPDSVATTMASRHQATASLTDPAARATLATSVPTRLRSTMIRAITGNAVTDIAAAKNSAAVSGETPA